MFLQQGPDPQESAQDSDVEYARSCPNAHFLFPGRHEFAETIRRPLKNFVNNVCPSRKTLQRKLRASEFQAGNSRHMSLLRDMGITIMALPDGRVQLLHTSSNVSELKPAYSAVLVDKLLATFIVIVKILGTKGFRIWALEIINLEVLYGTVPPLCSVRIS